MFGQLTKSNALYLKLAGKQLITFIKNIQLMLTCFYLIENNYRQFILFIYFY